MLKNTYGSAFSSALPESDGELKRVFSPEFETSLKTREYFRLQKQEGMESETTYFLVRIR